jgi:catechol 2,3-dioxygenase-like lactoylglutathione lyase family enzyme
LITPGIHHATLIVDDEERASWFYGQILGLEAKPRPGFKFPGLFFFCGEKQELHLIVAAKPLPREEDIFIQVDNTSETTRNFIRRHIALVVSDFHNTTKRLRENHIDILFDADNIGNDPDPLTLNLIEGWTRMYGRPPVFCRDPFGNLLEIIPGSADDTSS